MSDRPIRRWRTVAALGALTIMATAAPAAASDGDARPAGITWTSVDRDARGDDTTTRPALRDGGNTASGITWTGITWTGITWTGITWT